MNRSHRGKSPWYPPGKVCPWASRSVGCSTRSRRNPSEGLPKLMAKDCSGQEWQSLDIILNYYYFRVKCVYANMVHLLISNNATGNLCHRPPGVCKNILKPSHKARNQPAWSTLRSLIPLLSSAMKFVKTKLYLSGLGFPINFCLKTVGEVFIVFRS